MPTGSAGVSEVNYHTNQTHYLCKTIAYNTASSGAQVLMGYMPANSVALRVYAAVTTAFNAGTTNNISVGVSGTAASFGVIAVTSSGLKTDTGTLATAATSLLKPAAAQAVYVAYTQNATAAAAGSADVFFEFAMVR